jgi:hypothetical protein
MAAHRSPQAEALSPWRLKRCGSCWRECNASLVFDGPFDARVERCAARGTLLKLAFTQLGDAVLVEHVTAGKRFHVDVTQAAQAQVTILGGTPATSHPFVVCLEGAKDRTDGRKELDRHANDRRDYKYASRKKAVMRAYSAVLLLCLATTVVSQPTIPTHVGLVTADGDTTDIHTFSKQNNLNVTIHGDRVFSFSIVNGTLFNVTDNVVVDENTVFNATQLGVTSSDALNSKVYDDNPYWFLDMIDGTPNGVYDPPVFNETTTNSTVILLDTRVANTTQYACALDAASCAADAPGGHGALMDNMIRLVNPQVNVVYVTALYPNGTASLLPVVTALLYALDYVTANNASSVTLNLAWQGNYSSLVNALVEELQSYNAIPVVPIGNEVPDWGAMQNIYDLYTNSSCLTKSPTSALGAIVAGSVDILMRPGLSSRRMGPFGCVTTYAPGENVLGHSGTSFSTASPQVRCHSWLRINHACVLPTCTTFCKQTRSYATIQIQQ